ncbi:SIMPL domain-containing protein [Hahella ganghwensis]|uniref:SIMPL domain-containing protein n=1 Tax=Hahella ganghwensis TaxID=286420 RepID=UPI0003770935|nr:SIMPL domain-containing protein [Hahella ganghwensis]
MLIRIVLLMLVTTFAQADEVHYNRINLSANAKGELANDTLMVDLYAHAQEKDSETASRQVNEAMEWALKKAKRVEGIKVQTLGYRTNPVYRDQRIVAWKVEQQVQLESKNIEALASLTGELQERLSVNSMNYDASDDLRNEKENELIVEALASFNKRADIISQTLKADAYKITNINISTDQAGYYPRMEMARGAMMSMQAAPAAVEAGTQTVTVTVSGEVELQK